MEQSSSWKEDEMRSGNERLLRSFHYANRGKMREYYLGAIKDS